MAKVYASFPGFMGVTIEVDSDGVDTAVKYFYEIGAVFAAAVKPR